ncbi:MAG: hypothetical protein IPJ49_12425 [Candidatus Obscuribacter sp.]|jgi:hypothetical protein|nr:hypothetical protein [Candidatus Obscuribacter sp.]
MTSQNKRGGNVLLNILLFIPGVIYMALRESGKWICKKAYSGGMLRSIMIGLLGVGVAGVSAFSTADYLANTQGWGAFSWFASSVVVFILTMTHVWPAIYWLIIRHIWNFGDWFLKKSKVFAKEIFKPFVSGVVSVVRKAPGSDYLWSRVEGTTGGKSWGIKLLQVLLLVKVAALSALVGYLTFQACAGVATIPALAFLHLQEVIAFAVAFTAFYFTGAVLFALVDEGEAAATAMVYSGVTSYLLVAKAGIVSGAVPMAATAVVSSIVGITYVLPAFIAVLQGGLMEQVLKAWGKLLEAVYSDDENKDFRRFYHHVMNIVVAVAIAVVIKSAIAMVALPAIANWVVAVLVGVYCYSTGSRDVLNRSGGNALIGIFASGLTAYWAYIALPLTGAWLVVGTVVALVGTALLAYPFAYLLVRALTGWAAPTLGGLLESIHQGFANAFKKVSEGVRYVQRKAFDDRSGFGSLFGHLLNMAVAYIAVVQVLPMAQPYLPSSFWLNVGIMAVVGINVFVLLDRFFSRYGAETLALVTGGTAMFVAGHAVLAATGNWVSTVVVALVAGSVVGGIVAPIAYLIVRAPANLILTPWLGTLADKVFDSIWEAYAAIWSVIGRQFAWLTKFLMIFLAPVVAAVQSAWASVKAVLERFTGK